MIISVSDREEKKKLWKKEKMLVKKEKMLVTSIFSFSHNVFKSFLLEGPENQGLFGKGLKKSETLSPFTLLYGNADLKFE